MKILFVGDVMLGRLVNEMLRDKPDEFPWGDCLGIFGAADARVCNLECVISDKGVPWSATPKAFHFRSDAANIRCLSAAGIDAVSLANNHVFDFEYEAAFDSIGILDKAGIAHSGAGRDLGEASAPAFFNAGGFRAAIVSFTDNEPGLEALSYRPGIFYVPIDRKDRRAQALFDIIRKARAEADLVIAAAHWGPNWGYRPSPGHIPFAHAVIESGADVVYGHSCHVFQGVEIYEGRPIIYSAGDFVDDYAVDEVERNDESFIFIVEFGPEGRPKRLLLYPTMILRFQARRATGFLAEEIAFKMKRLSSGFETKARWVEAEQCLEITIG